MGFAQQNQPKELQDSEEQYREAMYRIFQGYSNTKTESGNKPDGGKGRFFSRSTRTSRPAPAVRAQPVRRQDSRPTESYNDAILGLPSYNPPQKAATPENISVNLTLKLGRPSFKQIKSLFAKKRRVLFRLGASALVIAMLFGGLTAYQSFRRDDASGVAGVAIIAPSNVFSPRPMPEGFSVGSSTEELENGAVVYTVYGPNGGTITITQHAKAADFDEQTLSGGLKFATEHGNGYVLESTERITGFLLAEESWVLLNSTDEITADEMRTFIKSLQPAKK